MLPACPADFESTDNQLLDATGDGLTDILRIEHDRVVLDLRTVLPSQQDLLATVLCGLSD
jgi:hypothetical protein